EITDELLREANVKTTPSAFPYSPALIEPVRFDGLSRVEIIDRLLARQGVSVNYQPSSIPPQLLVSVSRGTRKGALYTGPFRIDISGPSAFDRLARNGRATISVTANALDLPVAVWFTLWADDRPPPVTALAPGGKSVLYEERYEAAKVNPFFLP